MVRLTWLNMQTGLRGYNRTILHIRSCQLDYYRLSYVHNTRKVHQRRTAAGKGCRLCFCDRRNGFSRCSFLLSYRSFCYHIMLPIHPIKLQNQDELLRCTSRDVLLSTVSYVELYQIKKPRPVFLFTLTRCFQQIAPAPASLPPLLLPCCPHSCPWCRHCCRSSS
jgi:hypothetical protein